MSEPEPRPRLVGINHVALEVGDLDAALDFYTRIFAFELRGRVEGMAFLDMGDQFLALSEGRTQREDDHRHFGLVVDDLERACRAVAADPEARVIGDDGKDFHDPWGNRLQLVDYREIQFTKAAGVLRAIGLADLDKTDSALAELREKGMAPEA